MEECLWPYVVVSIIKFCTGDIFDMFFIVIEYAMAMFEFKFNAKKIVKRSHYGADFSVIFGMP